MLSLFDPLFQIHPSLALLCRNFTHFATEYTFSHFSISLTKSLFIDNNTTHILQHIIIHYPSFSHSIILKLHHFCYPKHIFISFFISHTKSPFLENNIINVITQKTTLAATLATFNLHIIYLTLPYIFQTYSPQNTHTYLSYIFKFHVSQSIYIYIYIYKIHVQKRYLHIIFIHITNTISHNIYIFLTISTHLKIYQTLFQELITKIPFFGKTKTYKIKSPSYERQYYSYLTKN